MRKSQTTMITKLTRSFLLLFLLGTLIACTQEGPIGPQGTIGETGQQGLEGPPSIDGDAGLPGLDGEIGSDGETIYQLYQSLYPGYTSSEEDFYKDLILGKLLIGISYETNGGEMTSLSSTFLKGDILTNDILPTPIKRAMLFDGWYADQDLEIAIEELTLLDSLTLYAKYIDDPDYTYPGCYTAECIETFDNLDEPGSTYETGSFIGEQDILWHYTEIRGDREIDGTALILRNTTPAALSATISEGIDSFKITFQRAFSVGDAFLELYINNTLIDTSPISNSNEPNDYIIWEVDDIAIDGTFTIELKSGDRQVIIDNLTWTPYTQE